MSTKQQDPEKTFTRGPYKKQIRDLSSENQQTNQYFKDKRYDLHKTIEEMAKYLGISPRLIWRLENEEIIANKRIMDKVAKKLGQHPVEIFYPEYERTCPVCKGRNNNNDNENNENNKEGE